MRSKNIAASRVFDIVHAWQTGALICNENNTFMRLTVNRRCRENYNFVTREYYFSLDTRYKQLKSLSRDEHDIFHKIGPRLYTQFKSI